jgi:hypothetical protein
VRYSLKFLKSTLDEPRSGVTLGVCDDGREHFVWAYNIAFLQLFDLEANAHAGDSPGRLYIGTSYAVELRHDGTRATLSCEGTEQASIDVGTRQAGALFLCTGTECPIVIERLEIEGQLRPYGLARLRQAWIERELAPFR